jgi:hypothetical protein
MAGEVNWKHLLKVFKFQPDEALSHKVYLSELDKGQRYADLMVLQGFVEAFRTPVSILSSMELEDYFLEFAPMKALEVDGLNEEELRVEELEITFLCADGKKYRISQQLVMKSPTLIGLIHKQDGKLTSYLVPTPHAL